MIKMKVGEIPLSICKIKERCVKLKGKRLT